MKTKLLGASLADLQPSLRPCLKRSLKQNLLPVGNTSSRLLLKQRCLNLYTSDKAQHSSQQSATGHDGRQLRDLQHCTSTTEMRSATQSDFLDWFSVNPAQPVFTPKDAEVMVDGDWGTGLRSDKVHIHQYYGTEAQLLQGTTISWF